MKTAQQHTKSSAGPSVGVRVTPQSRSRPGAGNHHRQSSDGFERQADEVASRVVRGESNIVSSLSPTAAASYSLPSSSGRPLPRALRMELENSIGADLSEVRIH